MENKPSKGDEGRQSLPRLFYNKIVSCRFIIAIFCLLIGIDKKNQHTIENHMAVQFLRWTVYVSYRSADLSFFTGELTTPPQSHCHRAQIQVVGCTNTTGPIDSTALCQCLEIPPRRIDSKHRPLKSDKDDVKLLVLSMP